MRVRERANFVECEHGSEKELLCARERGEGEGSQTRTAHNSIGWLCLCESVTERAGGTEKRVCHVSVFACLRARNTGDSVCKKGTCCVVCV